MLKVQELTNGPVKGLVEARIKEFEAVNSSDENKWFDELCFCILTANFSAKGALKIQNHIADGFRILSEVELAKKLADLGHRFPNARANYITTARSNLGTLKQQVTGFETGRIARLWLKDIKGLGMKEASHFLRNVGYKDVAIVDRHILNLLFEHGIIEDIKINPKKYLGIEQKMDKLSETLALDHARLDLYLWYMKTGQILK